MATTEEFSTHEHRHLLSEATMMPMDHTHTNYPLRQNCDLGPGCGLMSVMSHTHTTETMNTPSSSSRGLEFYFACAAVLIGVVGTAANSLILYAMVASKQHKKQFLVFNQNVLDLYSCLLLIITYTTKIFDVQPTGSIGYSLCMMLLSENLLWWGIDGSVINLVIITVERYVKVVHCIWSKTRLRNWMIYLAAACSWMCGITYNMALCFSTSRIIDGVCYGYVIWENKLAEKIHVVWNFVSFYVVVLCTFIFCYWRILDTIRRQAGVMAGHSAAGSSTQSNQIQSNIIKTMILVSAFYAVTWLPIKTYYLLVNVDSNLTLLESGYYSVVFIAFIYFCTNPFIYAIKFEPVKRILMDLIPCKKTSVQSDNESVQNVGVRTTRSTCQERY